MCVNIPERLSWQGLPSGRKRTAGWDVGWPRSRRRQGGTGGGRGMGGHTSAGVDLVLRVLGVHQLPDPVPPPHQRRGALDELGGLAVLARLIEFQLQGVKIIGVLDAGHGAEGVPKQATSLLQMPNGLTGPVPTVLYPACHRVHALDPGVLGRGKEVGACVSWREQSRFRER